MSTTTESMDNKTAVTSAALDVTATSEATVTSQTPWFYDNEATVVTVGPLLVGAVVLVLCVVLVNAGLDLKRRKAHTALLFFLCLLDTVGALCVLPPIALSFSQSFNPQLCSAFVFLTRWIVLSTMVALVLMALERYVCIAHPVWYQERVTVARTLKLLLLSLLATAAIAVLTFAGDSFTERQARTEASQTRLRCIVMARAPRPGPEATFLKAFALTGNLLLLLNIAFNVLTLRTLRSLMNRVDVTRASPPPCHEDDSNLRVGVFVLSIAFVTTSLPGTMLAALVASGMEVGDSYRNAATAMFMVSYAMDPAIYLALTPRYRRRIRRVVCYTILRRQPSLAMEEGQMQEINENSRVNSRACARNGNGTKCQRISAIECEM